MRQRSFVSFTRTLLLTARNRLGYGSWTDSANWGPDRDRVGVYERTAMESLQWDQRKECKFLGWTKFAR